MDILDLYTSVYNGYIKSNQIETIERGILLLKEHKALDFVFRSSEDDKYIRAADAKKCATTWFDKITELLNPKTQEIKLLGGLILLLETSFHITHEKYIKRYEKWIEVLVTIITSVC